MVEYVSKMLYVTIKFLLMEIESHSVLYNLYWLTLWESIFELKLLVIFLFKADRFIFSLDSSVDGTASNLRYFHSC